MKTAVEWLIDRIEDVDNTPEIWEQIKIKAKEMEKQQIIDAYDEGQRNPYEYSEEHDINWYDGRRYYNETFDK